MEGVGLGTWVFIRAVGVTGCFKGGFDRGRRDLVGWRACGRLGGCSWRVEGG